MDDTKQETELTNQQKMSAGLRELADFLEEQPELVGKMGMTLLKSTWEKDEFLKLAQQLKPFEKDVNDAHYNIFRMFGPIKLEVYCARNLVCTKRMVTKTIEVEEWDCPKILSINSKEANIPEDPAIAESVSARAAAMACAPVVLDGGVA